MTSETERIARLLEKTFDRQPWYGSSVMEILQKVSPEARATRTGKSHTIIELVLHMTSWRKFVIHRLRGDDAFQVSEDLNFPKAGAWEDAVAELKATQAELIAAIKSFPEERLGELVPSSSFKYTYYTLLHGIIQHDVYHIGQIAFINSGLK
ncbi:MAG TPA: DinB family protein [Cyclobacteriaceae bacterium]|nr:DinB family protein [Cyclobacteriaceae bacterium]